MRLNFKDLKELAFTVISAFAIFILISCGGQDQREQDQREQDQREQEQSEQDKEEQENMEMEGQTETKARRIDYPIPTPVEVTTMLNDAGASYISGLPNPVENADSYITEASKALNLGVYGTDLSYACTYNNAQQINLYLEKFHKLTEDLGVKSLVNKKLVQRVEQNISNLDSMHAIISNSYYDTFDYLNENDKGDVSVLVLAGGWIEGLYISTQLAKSAIDKEEMLRGITEQKSSFKELLTLTLAYKEKNEAIEEIYRDLILLEDIFNSMTAGEPISEENLNVLSEKIEIIRNEIIQ
jgi:hypothetical protein